MVNTCGAGGWQGNSLLLIYSLIATPGLRGEHRYHQEIGTRDPQHTNVSGTGEV